ncbi:hypothetical protein [Streptomyces sp. TRM49041]|nr:hypothetical protein [Streptomyces sp. TRM49041]
MTYGHGLRRQAEVLTARPGVPATAATGEASGGDAVTLTLGPDFSGVRG